MREKPVFELDQIRRAAELGVGVGSASAVELVPLDEQSLGVTAQAVSCTRRSEAAASKL